MRVVISHIFQEKTNFFKTGTQPLMQCSFSHSANLKSVVIESILERLKNLESQGFFLVKFLKD